MRTEFPRTPALNAHSGPLCTPHSAAALPQPRRPLARTARQERETNRRPRNAQVSLQTLRPSEEEGLGDSVYTTVLE